MAIEEQTNTETIGDITRRLEDEFISGTTQLSRYVHHSPYDTLNRIHAYLNSQHISGEKDSQNRLKPFLNIVVAMANIWYRAIDLDPRQIRIFSKKQKEWTSSFFANVVLQDWMKREYFGAFLNEWGRVQSRYNSALLTFIEGSDGDLHVGVENWNRLIFDSVDIEAAPIIKILELSEDQLWERVEENGYDADAVQRMIQAKQTRETTGREDKDSGKADYYKLYEVHAKKQEFHLTDNPKDTGFVQQMHVISFVEGRQDSASRKDYEDFTLFRGREDNPHMLTHLLKEDDRALAIGPVEYLFDAQWMQNHAAKNIKDQLDIASKLLLQTADDQFLGRNVLTALEHGDILIYDQDKGPMTQVHNHSHDTANWQNFADAWKATGRELVGISEAMLGIQPKAGTAWRLQEAILDEGHSLFEVFVQNRTHDLKKMLRERIIPHAMKKYNTNEEIAQVFEDHSIERIDARYIKNKAVKRINRKVIDAVLNRQPLPFSSPEEQAELIGQEEAHIKSGLDELGGQRFFAPDEVNWKKQFKGIEWDVEIEIKPDDHNLNEMLTTINTAIKMVTAPGFEQNPRAKALVGRALELVSAMSPIEYNSLPEATPQGGGRSVESDIQLQEKQEQKV